MDQDHDGHFDGLHEERLSGKRVFGGRLLQVDVDEVRLPNGSAAKREVVRHPGAAVVLPVHRDGRVVLVRQYRYPLGGVLLELPAGKLDPGEDPEQTARRELAEETGLGASQWDPLGPFYTTPGFSDEVLHCFLARGLTEGERAVPDDDEALEVVVLGSAEVREWIRQGKIRDGKTLACLYLAAVHGLYEVSC